MERNRQRRSPLQLKSGWDNTAEREVCLLLMYTKICVLGFGVVFFCFVFFSFPFLFFLTKLRGTETFLLEKVKRRVDFQSPHHSGGLHCLKTSSH